MAERYLAPADARVFLGRLTHLDPGALVRLRPAGAGRTALWARLPWGVLVTREVSGAAPGDFTFGAAALLAAVDHDQLPPRRDPEWSWPLPPAAGAVVEEIPARTLREVASAAAGTLREVSSRGLQGRPVGARLLREALLDHVPIVVEGADRVEVPQRLVQAINQMGFLGGQPAGVGDEPAASLDPPDHIRQAEPAAVVRVRRADRWVGLAARFGTGWLPPPASLLSVRPVS